MKSRNRLSILSLSCPNLSTLTSRFGLILPEKRGDCYLSTGQISHHEMEEQGDMSRGTTVRTDNRGSIFDFRLLPQ